MADIGATAGLGEICLQMLYMSGSVVASVDIEDVKSASLKSMVFEPFD